MGNQCWGRRELRGACSDLRDSSSGHCQGQDEREAVGHWPGQLQKDPHGETRASGCSPPSRLCDSRSTVPPREDGNACDGWMLDLSVTRYTVCDRDLLEQNFGWNDTGDRHRVCVQWSADVWNCLCRSAHLPLASLHADGWLDGRCADFSVIAVWVLFVEDGGCGEGP